jgi:hypothetical protein
MLTSLDGQMPPTNSDMCELISLGRPETFCPSLMD